MKVVVGTILGILGILWLFNSSEYKEMEEVLISTNNFKMKMGHGTTHGFIGDQFNNSDEDWLNLFEEYCQKKNYTLDTCKAKASWFRKEREGYFKAEKAEEEKVKEAEKQKRISLGYEKSGRQLASEGEVWIKKLLAYDHGVSGTPPIAQLLVERYPNLTNEQAENWKYNPTKSPISLEWIGPDRKRYEWRGIVNKDAPDETCFSPYVSDGAKEIFEKGSGHKFYDRPPFSGVDTQLVRSYTQAIKQLKLQVPKQDMQHSRAGVFSEGWRFTLPDDAFELLFGKTTIGYEPYYSIRFAVQAPSMRAANIPLDTIRASLSHFFPAVKWKGLITNEEVIPRIISSIESAKNSTADDRTSRKGRFIINPYCFWDVRFYTFFDRGPDSPHEGFSLDINNWMQSE